VKVIKLGKGAEAVTNSRVTVHYTGWFKKMAKNLIQALTGESPFRSH
jgi:hypothetical protein